MKKVLIGLLVLSMIVAGVFLYLRSSHSPNYDGKVSLQGLNNEVEVIFDPYGIPHIYASNAEDAYKALGYVHAQDRIFQMDIMRRAGTGSLAELLGEDLLEVDQFFRTLGLPKHAKWSTSLWEKEGDSDWKSATEAYVAGVNAFIENGNLPIEYTLLGSKPRTFTINDIHGVAGYMAFSFAMAVRTDPLVTTIARNWGPEYLKSLSVHMLPEHHFIPNNYPERDSETREIKSSLLSMLDKIPVPLLEGSNAWVIGPDKTASGSVLFCNDTHIGFAQPSVWYEAHLEYPGFSFYGNHLAGIPFGLVGHTRQHSIGLTMFENDDQDFFEEQPNPNNPEEVLYKGSYYALEERIDTIQVKGKDPVLFSIKESIHGPIINGVVPSVAKMTSNPVASWWVYVLEPSKAMEALWKLNHAQSIEEVEAAAPLIHAPGLNIMYGDKSGNIAWWAVAKLPIRPTHVDSKIFLYGADDRDEPLGWIPFTENPMSINPESGFVASANNQPDTLSNGTLFPGYYYPGDRWNRIAKNINTRNDWDLEKVKNIQLEAINETHPKNVAIMLQEINPQDFDGYDAIFQAVQSWNGNHGLQDIAPTLYYKWLYHTLHDMMADELGEEDFKTFLTTFLYIRSVPILIRSEDSMWWDNVHTPEKENRKQIIQNALTKSLQELASQLGTKSETWHWEKVVRLEHPHPLGAKKPLNLIFNVKAPAVTANEESINKLPFTLNSDGIYSVNSGPAMRIIIDFADVEGSVSVLPTGQSGNLFSPHYDDQAEMYAYGEYRPQLMNEQIIRKTAKSRLVFTKQE
jgi:penicillin G amidase